MSGAGAIRGGRVAIEIGADLSRFYKSLDALSARMRALGSSFQAIGARAAGAGAALAAPFGAALVQSAKFQDTMSAVAAVTNATGAEFEALRQRAMELGASTSFTAQQAAEGLQVLGQGGFTANEAIAAIGGTLDLARSGMMDLAAATEITVSTLRAFKMQASDSTKVADVLAYASAASNATISSLGESLSVVGGIAAGVGVSLEEVTAMLAVLADRGQQGSVAGTGLRRIFVALASEQAKLKKLGVEVKDPKTGRLKPVLDIIDELRTKMAGMDDLKKLEELTKIFDVFGANAIFNLMNAGDAAQDMLNKLRNEADGTGRRIAQMMDDNLGGSFRMFMSAVEAASLAIGEALTPSIRGLLQEGQKLAAGLALIVQRNADFIVNMAKAAVATVALGGAFIGTGLSLKVLALSLSGFATALRVVTAPLGLLATMSKGVVQSFQAIGLAGFAAGKAVIAGLLPVISALTAALTAVSAAVATTVVRFAAMAASSLVVDVLRSGISQLAVAAARFVVTGAVVLAWTAGAATQMAVYWGVVATQGITKHVAAFVGEVAHYMRVGVAYIAWNISASARIAAAWLTRALPAILTFVAQSVAAFVRYGAQLAVMLAQDAIAAARIAATWVATALRGILQFAAGAAIAMGTYLARLAQAVAATVAQVAVMAAAWLAPIAPILALIAAVGGIGVAIVKAIQGMPDMSGVWSGMAEGITGALQTALAHAQVFFGDLLRIGMTTFSGISDAIQAGDMGLAMEVAWLGITAAWQRGQAGIMGYLDQFVGYFQDAWDTASTYMAKAMTSATHTAYRSWVSFTGSLYDAWSMAVNGVMAVWDQAIGAIQKAIAYVRSFLDSSIDYDAVAARVDEANEARAKARGDASSKAQQQRQAAIEQSRTNEQGALAVLDADQQKRAEERAGRTAERDRARRQAAMDTEADLDARRNFADRKKKGMEEGNAMLGDIASATTDSELSSLWHRAVELMEEGLITPELLEQIREAIDDQTLEIDKARAMGEQGDVQKKIEKEQNTAGSAADVAGTFSAFQAAIMGGQTPVLNRVAAASERTARATERMASKDDSVPP